MKFIFLIIFLIFFGSCKNSPTVVVNEINEKKEIKFPFSTDNRNYLLLPIGYENIDAEARQDNYYNFYKNGIDEIKNIFPILKLDTLSSIDKTLFEKDYRRYESFNNLTLKYFNFFISSKYLKINDFNCFLVLAEKQSNNPNRENQSLYIITTSPNGNVIDSKMVYYQKMGDFEFTNTRLFYFNQDEIILIRDIEVTEDPSIISTLKMFKINNQGKFIRYFENNGIFKSIEEEGLVKNNTKEGKWIDFFFILIDDSENFLANTIYLESEFKEGIPVGTWKYHELIQDHDANGSPNPETQKKGRLLYTEIYEYGDLKERKFVKE